MKRPGTNPPPLGTSRNSAVKLTAIQCSSARVARKKKKNRIIYIYIYGKSVLRRSVSPYEAETPVCYCRARASYLGVPRRPPSWSRLYCRNPYGYSRQPARRNWRDIYTHNVSREISTCRVHLLSSDAISSPSSLASSYFSLSPSRVA